MVPIQFFRSTGKMGIVSCKWLSVAGAILANLMIYLPVFSQCPDVLSTNLAPNGLSLGITFQITALRPVQLCRISIPAYRPETLSSLEVWMHPNGLPWAKAANPAINDGLWVKVGAVSNFSIAATGYTEIPIDLSTIGPLLPSQKIGFAIFTNSDAGIWFCSGSAPYVFSDSNLSFDTQCWSIYGETSGNTADWTSTTFPMQFCGTVSYSPYDTSPGNLNVAIYDLNADTTIPGATVQMIVGGTLSQVTNAGGDAVFSGLSPGTYVFKVTKPNYTVDSGLSTTIIGGQTTNQGWFLTWIGQVPSAPNLYSPSNGATGMVLPPTLSWGTVAHATSYSVQVATLSEFAGTLSDGGNLTTTSFSATGLLNAQQYYWRVNASDLAGSSAWLWTWSFSTISMQVPLSPSLVSPANGANNVSTSPTLTWGLENGATSYRVQVSNESSFSLIIYDQAGLYNASASVDKLPVSKKIYWRVNASNSLGTSVWSSLWNFTTSAVSVLPRVYTVHLNSFSAGRASVRYDIPKPSNVSIVLYDLKGRAVEKYFNAMQYKGSYELNINKKNALRGQYLLVFKAGSYVVQKLITLIE